MAQIEAADFADLILATQAELGKPNFQLIAQNLPEYEVLSRWFKQDKVQFESGRAISRNLMTKISSQAEWVGVLDTVSPDIPDLLDQMVVKWRHLQAPYAIEYRTDVLMNSGDEMITDLIPVRRADALISLAEKLESGFWTVPSASNKTEPWGLPYWLVANTSTGFNGGLNNGYSDIAGVSVTDSPNFKNYTAQYTTANKADLVKKMKKGLRSISWRDLITQDDFRNGAERYRVYMDETTISEIEDIGEAQNENLGKDVAPTGAARDVRYLDNGLTMVFRSFPIIHSHQMDDTDVFSITDVDGNARTNPVYLVDHSTFYPVCLKGDYLRETEPIRLQDQPNVYMVVMFLTTNAICVDRRRNAVFAK